MSLLGLSYETACGISSPAKIFLDSSEALLCPDTSSLLIAESKDTTFLVGTVDAALRHPTRGAAALFVDAAQVRGGTDRALTTATVVVVVVVVVGMQGAGHRLVTGPLSPDVGLLTAEGTGGEGMISTSALLKKCCSLPRNLHQPIKFVSCVMYGWKKLCTQEGA